MIVSRSFESELSKCYANKEIISIINSQLLELHYLPEVKCLNKFTIIKFSVPCSGQNYKFTTDNHEIQFYIVLGWGYPVAAPRLHMKDQVSIPGVNDCRNLLSQTLDSQQWSYKITLKRIQIGIPKLLEKLHILTTKQNIYHISRFGTFALNTVYPMELVRELRGDNIFFALEFKEQNQFKMVAIDISSTHLSIFITKQQPHYQNGGFKIPQQNQITNCMLIFYAELSSISDIYIDRNSFSDIHLTFHSKKPQNMSLQQVSATKRFKVKRGLNFVHRILKGVKNYNPLQTSLTLNSQNLGVEEAFLQKQIKKAEETLKTHLNLKTIKQLADRYQSAVEFYSSGNVPYYEIYLDSITKLYQRQEVKVITGEENILKNQQIPIK